MADERKRRRWPWVVLALVVLYPLSSGPMIGLVVSVGFGEDVWETLYAPLDFWRSAREHTRCT